MLESIRPPAFPHPETEHAPHAAPAEPLSVNFFLDAFRRRWAMLFACVVVALALGGAYILVTPKKYAATTTLLIDTRLAQLSQTEATATVVDQAAVESQIELIQSERMLSVVIDKLDLLNDPEFGKATAEEADAAPVSADVARQRALTVLAAGLGVGRVGRSYLVSVTYTSPDPAKAARIANEVANTYISDQIGAKVQAAKDQNAWLDGQVNEMRTRSTRDYRAVQQFKAAHDIDPFADLRTQQDADRLSGEVSLAQSTADTARIGMDSADALLAGPGRTDYSPPDAAALRRLSDPELDRDASRYDELGDKLKAAGGGGGAASLQAEQDGALKSLWASVRAVAVQRRSDWVAASARQRASEAALADVRLRDTRARLLAERLRALETEAATSRSLYESYLNQLTHAGQQQPVPAGDTRVVSPAAVPLYPSKPKKLLTLALAGMAGVAFGLAGIFVVENMDDVIRTRHQVEVATDMSCLGVIPTIRRRTRWRKQLTPGENLRHSFPHYTGASPRSRGSDTLRSLQLATLRGGRSMGGSVLGVTSAVAGEGKSTTVYNLAISASRAGRKVLVVDCNLRNPTFTHLIAPGQAPVPLLGLRQSVPTGDGFDLLPASAQHTIEGAEMPDADLLRALLADARADYDLVVVDLPAILPLSELRSIIPEVDLLVLLIRWGSTTVGQVQRALARLAGEDRAVGVVLNGVEVRKMRRFEGSRNRSYADRA